MRPMLASRGTTVPTGPEWVHEVKWDGMRVLVAVRGGALRVYSRNEKDVTISFPELAGLADPGLDVVLDGEVIAFLDGLPVFGALADRLHVANAGRAAALAQTNPVTLMVFDLLRLGGRDLTGRPLRERRAALEELGLAGKRWQVPAVYEDGYLLLEATARQGLEGVVSKKLGSPYLPGRRSPDWLKFPHRATLSYVVGGWRLETDSASRLGAVLVGQPTGDGLCYRGRVGSGIAGKAGQALSDVLRPLASDRPPFCDDVPRVDAKGTTWVRPQVVVEVASLGLTPGGRLRQPSFLGVRADLTPGDLVGSDA